MPALPKKRYKMLGQRLKARAAADRPICSLQTILFDSRGVAFNCLKKLISQDVLVMIIVHSGNHFVIATGYGEDYIYTNDSGWDNGYDYKIDGDPDLKQRRIGLDDFLNEWSIAGQEKEIGGKIGFPGNYGMIWLVET